MYRENVRKVARVKLDGIHIIFLPLFMIQEDVTAPPMNGGELTPWLSQALAPD